MTIFRMLILQCSMLYALAGYAQKEIEIPVNHRVVINFQDHIVYADTLASERKFKPKSGKYYFWYNANDIKRTRGGYDGKLLHGSYTEFFPDKNLRQKGLFRYGLKKGVWKTWYHSGEIQSVVRWRKGRMQGWFKYYDETGKLVKQGKHKDDLEHGKIDTFLSGGRRERNVYVHGLKKERKVGKSRNKKSSDADSTEKEKTGNKKERSKKKKAGETKVESDEKLLKMTESPDGKKRQKVSKPDTSEKKPAESKKKPSEPKKKKSKDSDGPKSDQKTTP